MIYGSDILIGIYFTAFIFKGYLMPHTTLKKHEVSMLRSEIEMLISERQSLLKTVGAAARFVENLDSSILPKEACKSAKILSNSLNQLNDETLRDALEKVKA